MNFEQLKAILEAYQETPEYAEDIKVIQYSDNDVKTFFVDSSYDNSRLGKYETEVVEGYTGSEGGGESVEYLIKITDTKTDEILGHAVMNGYYSSDDGVEIHVDYTKIVDKVESKDITVVQTDYFDDKGTVIYTLNKKKK